jgi:hypothetical protein
MGVFDRFRLVVRPAACCMRPCEVQEAKQIRVCRASWSRTLRFGMRIQTRPRPPVGPVQARQARMARPIQWHGRLWGRRRLPRHLNFHTSRPCFVALVLNLNRCGVHPSEDSVQEALEHVQQQATTNRPRTLY